MHKGRTMHFLKRRNLRNLGGLLLLLGISSWFFLGCDPPKKRFQVPEYQRRQNQRFGLYRRTSKVKLPRMSSIPLWDGLADLEKPFVFRPEVVKLQGQSWLRASNSPLFVFYFQHKNRSAGKALTRVSEQVARFVQLWTLGIFKQQLQIVLVPWMESVQRAQPNRKWPIVGRSQAVIFTGSDTDERLSKYGLVGELTQRLVRLLLTGSVKEDNSLLWRSVLIPAYFELRGTGALASRSYNRTVTPKSREILFKAGSPTVKDVMSLLSDLRTKTMPLQVHARAERIGVTFLGFLEDAYGRRTLAAVLQHLISKPKSTFSQSLQHVIGKTESVLWKEWTLYYYSQQWRRQLLDKL